MNENLKWHCKWMFFVAWIPPMRRLHKFYVVRWSVVVGPYVFGIWRSPD